MFRITYFWVLLLLLALLITGCAKPETQSSDITPNNSQESNLTPNTPSVNQAAKEVMQLTTYYASKDAMNLVPEINSVPVNNHPALTALELLIAGPHNPDLVSVIPPGTRVLGLKVKDHTAYVNFNDKLIKNNPGGSADEMLLVGAIVDTLTEFQDIQQVQILVNGNKIDTISGHMDISEPLGRSEKIIKKIN